MEAKYSLYYTLNQNVPGKKMTKAQDIELKKKLDSLDESAKKAVIMLMAEHSKVEDQCIYDGDNVVIPYNGIQDGDDVICDLKDFPNSLKWILWKFVNLGSSS